MTTQLAAIRETANRKSASVGLFIPCYIDMVYPEVGIATLQLLERFGLDVHFPLDQTCCGQCPCRTAEMRSTPLQLSTSFVENFAAYDYIVGPAGSCVKQVRCHF